MMTRRAFTAPGGVDSNTMIILSLFLVAYYTIVIVPYAATSLSFSSTILFGRSNGGSYGSAGRSIVSSGGSSDDVAASVGAAIPKLQFGVQKRNLPLGSSFSSSSTATSLHMALGRNYLDNMDNNRPSGDNNNNWNRGQQQQGGGGGGGVPKVFPIRQPQDLLDFVIQDERLSVVKVYASWCKTCKVFDVRYRKLASQLGDNYNNNDPSSADNPTSKGPVRFAEMQFDDPNNEEMCRLLNATKLPYILMYKGSKGKVADFQCGPAKFQMLIDAVNELVDPEDSSSVATPSTTTTAMGGAAAAGGEQQEWSVVREQQQKRNQALRQEQRATQYGSAGSIVNYPPEDSDGTDERTNTRLKLKDAEISRLYTELSNLRKSFDQRIVQLKASHTEETSSLNDRIMAQTKEYEEERRTLSAQIEDLRREMMEREKSHRADENAISQRLREEMKVKEERYKETLTSLNLRITELEKDLFESRNELQYNTDASSGDVQRLSNHIANLENEINNLTSRNQELEKELIEEKRVVVASTEEASRVLKQLERIKRSEDEERKELMVRIGELEGEIAQREKQMMNMNADVAAANNVGGELLAREMQQELDQLKNKHERERQVMSARIAQLEEELSSAYQSTSSTNNQSVQQLQELRRESERLQDRILEVENEIDERDKLLRTSNKATDILLDNMEAQKREYENELDRTASLVNELEEAITNREEEMGVLQERFDALERMAGELKRREEEREEAEAANAMRMSEMSQQQQQQQAGGMESLQMEREARMAAEQEVGKLMGHLREREEEMTRMQQQQQQEGGGSSEGGNGNNPFGAFGALFGAGGGGDGANVEEANSGWGGSWGGSWQPNNEESMENYEMLKDVLMPDEVSPRGGMGGMGEQSMPRSGMGRSENIWEGAPTGAGQSENIWEGAGLSSFMSSAAEAAAAAASGVGRSENIRDGAGSASSFMGGGATPSPSAASSAFPSTGQLPTPAMAFERRLAENPIVPAGAFGGSKPTASFFSPKSSGNAAAAPSDTPEYYQNAMSNFNNNRNDAPAMPPMASFDQRPTMPSPRGGARPGASENIYAGAGSAFPSSSAPAPSVPMRREEQPPPVAPLPTPAMAFERRLAENPIVPSGAFGGSQPTARFFNPNKPAAPPAPAARGGGGVDYSSPPQASSLPPEDDSQSKWQTLDDYEKKRVAAEAYKAFEKSLEDSRRTSTQKPIKGGSSMGSRAGGGGGGGGSGTNNAATANKAPTATANAAASTKQQNQSSNQMELERKKHQDMVKTAASSAAKEKKKSSGSPPPPKPKSSAPKSNYAPKQKQQQKQQQSAQQIQASAAQASAKRMSLAERAAKADQDRKDREKRLNAEARRAREAQSTGSLQRAAEAKRQEEIKRAEELKRKADADLQSALELDRKLAAEQEQTKARESVEAAVAAAATSATATNKQESLEWLQQEQPAESEENLDTHERIEAALLGADEGQEEQQWPVPKTKRQTPDKETTSSTKRQKKAPPRKKKATRVVAGYNVVVMKDPKQQTAAIDMPQILEGSLKDLLKDGSPPEKRRRRSSLGDNNY